MATESRLTKAGRLNLPNSANVTVGNTTTETALWTSPTVTIASDIGTSTVLSVRILGFISVADTTAIDTGLVLKLKYGTTAIATLTLADDALDNFSDRPFIIEAQCRISATGAGGGAWGGISLRIATDTAANAQSFAAHPAAATSVDFSAASTFSVSADWVEANSGNTLTVVSVQPVFQTAA